jgi:hypothetical protein
MDVDDCSEVGFRMIVLAGRPILPNRQHNLRLSFLGLQRHSVAGNLLKFGRVYLAVSSQILLRKSVDV